MNRQSPNFLLKGGRLIDPASGKDGIFDVRVRDGKIEAIGENLDPNGTAVIDVKNQIVTPGLIDVHLHLMKGLGAFGVDPDIFGVGSGFAANYLDSSLHTPPQVEAWMQLPLLAAVPAPNTKRASAILLTEDDKAYPAH